MDVRFKRGGEMLEHPEASNQSTGKETAQMAENEYNKFLHDKRISVKPAGFDPVREINHKLFDFQKDTTKWGLRKGKSAFFQDCGLGKTAQQLEWASHVAEKTSLPVIVFAPLAV